MLLLKYIIKIENKIKCIITLSFDFKNHFGDKNVSKLL